MWFCSTVKPFHSVPCRKYTQTFVPGVKSFGARCHGLFSGLLCNQPIVFCFFSLVRAAHISCPSASLIGCITGIILCICFLFSDLSLLWSPNQWAGMKTICQYFLNKNKWYKTSIPCPRRPPDRASFAVPKPSSRHTTVADSRLHLSSHMVPHSPFFNTSTRPSPTMAPPRRRTNGCWRRQTQTPQKEVTVKTELSKKQKSHIWVILVLSKP